MTTTKGLALARLWRDGKAAFLADWRATDPSARRRFVRVLWIGLGLVLGLAAVVALGAESWLGGREADLEAPLVLGTESWAWPSLHKAVWVEEPGGSTMLLPLVLLATWTAARLGRSLEAVAIAASFVGAKPILFVGRVLFDRERPQVIADGLLSPTTNSFPSGHTLQAFCVWGVLAYLWIRASGSWLERTAAVLLWLAVGITVAMARLRLGTHWPSDLAAGALLGMAWAGVLVVALRAGRRATER